MRLTLAALACVAGFAAQSPAQNIGTATLKGRVVAADTGSPVRRASIQLERKGIIWSASTDDDGRFVVPDLPAGRCTIRVSRPGFVTWLFGREPAGSRSRVTPLELKDRQTLDRGELRLPRGGVITGRIVDEFGDPIGGTDVRALRLTYLMPGEGRLDYVKHATTNDLGEYRIFDLPPGRYFVAIGLSAREAVERAEQSSPTVRIVPAAQGTAPQFYPGTARATDATPVVIDAGGVVAGIDIRQQSVPLAVVSGIVTSTRGTPASHFIVMLHPARADAVFFTMMTGVEPDREGRFHFANIAPGDYRVDVVLKARLEAIGQTGSSAARPAGVIEEVASVPVTVAGRDIEGLDVRTGRGFTLDGRINVDGASSVPPDFTATVVANPVMRREGVSGVLLNGTATAQSDGRFAVSGVAGKLLLRAYGISGGLTLKSVLVNGIDVTDAGIDVQSDLKSVEIIVTAKPTRVTAKVVDTSGAAVHDYAAVVVFSSDDRRWTTPMTRYVTSAKRQADSVTLSGLPPGDYYAGAVDILEPDWASPAQLEQLRRTATPFTLNDGETKTLTVVRKN